ncbi:hypothetical protein C1H87_01490 [Flavivirga eckloniae]|uniref:Uncharacterized protein n=2 Tax=Flavivirga eckloniae TaxID=1803846 RepID=A0A2K9PK66_9FLAO|nr:hypothetical protein C1H87_01490 [Flavivirga eckloniae]
MLLSQEIDTLRVYQNDTLVFKKALVLNHRDKSEHIISYDLINPIDKTYYVIYNDKKQLVKEGMYTSNYTYESIQYGGGFYNVKYYYYNNQGKLRAIAYLEDGRHLKTEHYKGQNELQKIRYIDKKTELPVKMEFYKNNKLKRIKVLTNYYVNG